MSENKNGGLLPDISPSLKSVYRSLVIDPGLWNHPPNPPYRFAGECGKLQGLGINPFREDILWRLWQTGLLRADIVLSKHASLMQGLEEVEEASQFSYQDFRSFAQTDHGWIGILGHKTDRPAGMQPRFHRYRYLVLLKILEVVKPSVSLLQLMFSDEGIITVAREWQENMRRHTASSLIADFVNHWNSIASLAAACEPVAFPRLSGIVRTSMPDSFAEAYEKREYYFLNLKPAINSIGLKRLEEFRTKLCRLAQQIEPNMRVQMLLRQARYRRREALRGNLGSAMLLLEMAECLRRVAERVFDHCLPEEDQMNYTVWAKDARRDIYGSERAIDASRSSSKIFIRYFGLDPGIKVRCYVEGDTEMGALEYSLGPYEHIEIINLRGQVSAARGKGLTFRENLVSDIRKKVFSFLILDGDRGDNLRAARQAIRDGTFFGEIFISEPDFELQNFSLHELRLLILHIAEEKGSSKKELVALKDEMKSCVGVQELVSRAKIISTRLSELGKGKTWGSRLIQYAIEIDRKEGWAIDQVEFERPMLKMIARILQATQFHYDLRRESSRVDPHTGRIVPIT